MTLREKRHREVTNALNRTIAQRDGCLANLVKYETRLKSLRRQVQRLEKAMAAEPKPKSEVQRQPPSKPVPDVTDIPISELPIPDFLDRRIEAARRKDKEAGDKLRAEQAERKRQKSLGRISTMKAAQAGDRRKMPLTGKAALEAIRQG